MHIFLHLNRKMLNGNKWFKHFVDGSYLFLLFIFFFFFDIGVRVISSLQQPWNNQQPTMTINQLHLLPVNTFSLFSILFFFVHSSNPYQINQLTIDPFSQNDKIAIGNTHLSQPQQQSNMMYHSFICPSPTHCKFDSIIY